MERMSLNGFSQVKVFSATKHTERGYLGETVSDWIAANKPQIVDTVVTQSSDSEFHMIAITIFYNKAA